MAKTMATVVAGMAMAAGSMAAPAVAAEPAEAMTVVLHVADYQHVPSRDLVKAQQVASAVYARIGVQLVWTTGAAPAEPDGALHADVVIMDRAMAQRDNRDSKVFGQASHHTRLAKVYASRVRDHAFATGSFYTMVLGLVLAHEVGHVILPDYSHSSSGVMQAYWEGKITRVPGFHDAQAVTIRTTLVAQH